jgi:hypothetical protein
MPSWIEFHDSVLTGIKPSGKDVSIDLDAYVHQWKDQGGESKGTGWMQSVAILVKNTRQGIPGFVGPSAIDGGRLRVSDALHDGLVPLPFVARDAVHLTIELVGGGIVEAAGDGVRLEATGKARYVEDLPGDFRPRNAG